MPSASRTSSRNERSDSSAVTPSSPPGRNRIGRIWSTTGSYSVTMSRSQNVNTVSRCMAARPRGIWAPITSRAAPASNRLRARMLAARAVLRSPRPISTTPSPTGMMSPPSSEAPCQSWSTPPYQNLMPGVRKRGWKR